MVSKREYIAFGLYLTFAFSVADPVAGVREVGRSIGDLVHRETHEVRSIVGRLDRDERAFLGRYALCVANDPLDLVRFAIESYRGREPTSECVERAN
jgi:hypothetical protein